MIAIWRAVLHEAQKGRDAASWRQARPRERRLERKFHTIALSSSSGLGDECFRVFPACLVSCKFGLVGSVVGCPAWVKFQEYVKYTTTTIREVKDGR